MMRIPFDEPRPLTCHILLTTACNFDCEDCFYRKSEPAEIPFDKLVFLLEDLAFEGVYSVAFGGGEPTLYPKLNEAVNEAKKRGFYVAVTTNGATKHYFNTPPDRVHISYSVMHRAAMRRSVKVPWGKVIPWRRVVDVLHYYKIQGSTVGVNYIYENIRHFKLIDTLFHEADNMTILMKKPVEEGQDWTALHDYIEGDRERYWLDACLVKLVKGIPCRQGVSSLSMDQNLTARRCSNTETGIPYTTLEKTWPQIIEISDCILGE